MTAELEPGGFAWYPIIPLEHEVAFLGLTEKYAGFSAVEEMWSTKNSVTAILREQGPTGFACLRKPDRVFCNGADVTERLSTGTCSGPVGIYTIDLPPEGGRAVLEVRWSKP